MNKKIDFEYSIIIRRHELINLLTDSLNHDKNPEKIISILIDKIFDNLAGFTPDKKILKIKDSMIKSIEEKIKFHEIK